MVSLSPTIIALIACSLCDSRTCVARPRSGQPSWQWAPESVLPEKPMELVVEQRMHRGRGRSVHQQCPGVSREVARPPPPTIWSPSLAFAAGDSHVQAVETALGAGCTRRDLPRLDLGDAAPEVRGPAIVSPPRLSRCRPRCRATTSVPRIFACSGRKFRPFRHRPDLRPPPPLLHPLCPSAQTPSFCLSTPAHILNRPRFSRHS
jgi:hypothetical protein